MEISFGMAGNIILRSLVAMIVLFLLAKIIGPRQIAQLTFYDYVVGISIGSIAGAIAADPELSLWGGLIAMAIFTLLSIAMSYAGMKSLPARRFFSGTPHLLVCRGRIIEEAMKKQKFDVNDLLAACRAAGYFDIADLEYVIMEINGALSFLPKSEKAPLTPADMNLSPAPAAVRANVIIDGCVMEHHLRSVGLDRAWLEQRLNAENISDLKEVLLAVADEQGGFKLYRKHVRMKDTDLLD